MTIVNNTVNDIAATVLPDAPIDYATGLPVPTIAVATAGGVSVIKDDGTVVDLLTAQGIINKASFTEDYGLVVAGGGGVAFRVFKFNSIPAADTNAFDIVLHAGTSPSVGAPGNTIGLKSNLYVNNTWYIDQQVAKRGFVAVFEDRNDISKSLVAEIRDTYNTGWMAGDIKGAFLSDTDDTDLVGSGVLVTLKTPDVACVPSRITLSGSTITVDARVGEDNKSSISEPFVGLKENTSYVLTFTKTSAAGGGAQSALIGVGFGLTSSGVCDFGGHLREFRIGQLQAGDYSFTFTTGTRINDVGLFMRSVNVLTDTIHSINNISVKEADFDRSVNNKSLIINGTVTRTPVATGADLVGYTFASSAFLRGFGHGLGAGDFSVIAWYKPLDTGAQIIANFVNSDLSAENIALFISSGNFGHGFFGGASGTSTGLVPPVGQWSLLEISRKDGVLNASLNGRRGYSAAYATDFSANLDLLVGVNRIFTNPADGSTALLRISATAPSPDQIAKIYNDEKFLYQDNAQATLFGASNAVTALAHDSATDLLHVGTSAGRSVFSGLRRVSNTTTAVGTAISASNGLIAEE